MNRVFLGVSFPHNIPLLAMQGKHAEAEPLYKWSQAIKREGSRPGASKFSHNAQQPREVVESAGETRQIFP